jgi:L-arabinose transport system substrate-binding protein
MSKRVKFSFLIALSLIAVFAVAGCKKQGGKAEKSDLKFVYVSKMLSHPWFKQEEMGIIKACEELGIDYIGIDSNLNDEKCLADVDSVFSMEADALLICMTNQSMGPNIAERCREEGVVLVTIDDNVVDEFGKPVPHVGMPTKESGELGGKALAELAVARGFFAPGNVVKVLQIDVPTTTVFAPRVEGYREALMANSPLKREDFIVVDTSEGMYEDNLAVSSPVIIGNPGVTHWIITGANDDCALAPMTILEEQNFNMDNVLACGLGGYEMSLEEFKNGNSNYICIVLGPDLEGYQAVQIAYNNIVNKTPMPDFTLVAGNIATSENYLTYFPNGKLMTDQ